MGSKHQKEVDALLGPYHEQEAKEVGSAESKLEEELLRGLLDESDRDFVMSKLMCPPSDFTNEGVRLFVDLIRKRLYFLVCKREAYARAFQAQITNSLGLGEPASVSELPKAAEIGIRAGVRLMISLLRSVSAMDQLLRQDGNNKSFFFKNKLNIIIIYIYIYTALDFFLELLSELKPLDLWGDGTVHTDYILSLSNERISLIHLISFAYSPHSRTHSLSLSQVICHFY